MRRRRRIGSCGGGEAAAEWRRRSGGGSAVRTGPHDSGWQDMAATSWGRPDRAEPGRAGPGQGATSGIGEWRRASLCVCACASHMHTHTHARTHTRVCVRVCVCLCARVRACGARAPACDLAGCDLTIIVPSLLFTHTLALLPSVKKRVLCVGDGLKMVKHKAPATTIAAPKSAGYSRP